MLEHPTDQAFVDFAIGALEGEAARSFEDHVSTCDACASRLADEARLELEIVEAAAAARAAKAPRTSVGPGRAFARLSPFAVAAAAAVIFAFARGGSAEASGPIPGVVCPDAPEQGTCVERAHARGLFVAYPPSGGAPELGPGHGAGWSLSLGTDDYELRRETGQRHRGTSSVRIASKSAEPAGAGVLAQSIDATPYRGKKIRWSAFVKTSDVSGWSGLWMRVDERSGGVQFDNMQSRPLRGSRRWAEHDVVLAVAADATKISFGALQSGGGVTFVDDARFEVVAADAPVTSADDRPLTLGDGGFERGSLDENGWFMSGGARTGFEPSLDRDVRHAGRVSARIRARAERPDGYGVLMRAMRAEPLRGQRLRLRGFVRGDGIAGRGDFWVRVQAADSPGDGPGLGYGACRLEGSFDFRVCEMVFDVGRRADSIEIGLGLGGPGTAWMDDLTLEPVDAATTPIAGWRPTPERLENGDFEGTDSIRPWMISGNAFESYRGVIDHEEHHGGAASVRLEPSPGATPRGYGSIFQGFAAASFRGKRLRGIAWVKGEGVGGRGDLWVRVQGATSPRDGGGLGGGHCRFHDSFHWQPCAIVFDVPEEGARVEIGAGLDGPGRLWIDDVGFEVVDSSVPTTNPPRPAPRPVVPPASRPVDLDFEAIVVP